MKTLEKRIRECALSRIADIFGVPVEQLRHELIFGKDLNASFVSDFRFNQLDQVFHDIRDVADRKITREFSKGLLTICTVGEYCDHMVRCYETMPEEVSRILGL